MTPTRALLVVAALALALAPGCRCGSEVHHMDSVEYDGPTMDPRIPATWAHGLPGVRWEQRIDTGALVLHSDRAGNIVLAASLEVPSDIGGKAVGLNRDVRPDVLVASLAQDGKARWAVELGSDGLDNVEDMAVDERGFITITGTYSGPITFGGDPLPVDPKKHSFRPYLARLDPGGAPLLGRGPFTRGYHALGAMDGGAIVTSGYESFTIEAVDERLQRRWSASCDRDEGTRGQPEIVGLGSGAIVAGNSGSRITCKGPKGPRSERMFAAPSTTGVFVARVLEGGKIAWLQGPPSEGTFGGLAVSPTGRIALGVNTSTQAWIQVLDAEGKNLFMVRFTPERGESAKIAALAMDAAGGLVVAGDFEGALDVAGTRLVALGRDVFVARLTPDGALVWARRFGDEQSQSAAGVALDGAGGVVVTGKEAIRKSGDRSIEDWFVLDLLP